MNEEIKLDSKIVFQGKVITVYHDLVRCPNGKESYREIVKHPGGASILFINQKEEILLIKQYRYAYQETLYEIPAGKLEVGEPPIEAARRELTEETGYVSELEYLGVIYPTVGYSNEKIYLYLAKGGNYTATHFDEDENITSAFYPLEEVYKMINSGVIQDAKTICALQFYQIKKTLRK